MTSLIAPPIVTEPSHARRFRQTLRKLSARKWPCVAIVGLLAFVVSAGFSFLRPPLPRIHDEFSYLLAADTFAHGRLSNPTHPFWVHFETFHVLQKPSYASKYPPAQGIFLAIGQRLTGLPIVGVWLSVSLGCAGVCWMLQGWTRPKWAFLGGLLTALHHGIHGGVDDWGHFYSWSQSFWGGGVAMLGGALAVGALPRLMKRTEKRDAVALGVGLSLLAFSRPFEGLLLCAPVLLVFGLYGLRSTTRVRTLLPPLLLVLTLSAVAMGASNKAITGSAFMMPYTLYERTYNPALMLTGGQGPTRPPIYTHEILRRFFTEWCAEQWTSQRTWSGWRTYHGERLSWLRAFFVGPLLIPCLMLPATLRRPKNFFAAAECGLIVLAHLFTFGIQPHYAAPAMGCFMLLVVEGMRRLNLLRFGGIPIGPLLVGSTLLMVSLRLGYFAHEVSIEPPGWEAERASFATSLKGSGECHLVVVRYQPDHDIHEEWVANAADIDASAVVWARETDPDSMQRLFAYFKNRRIWLLEADNAPRRLQAYSEPARGDR